MKQLLFKPFFRLSSLLTCLVLALTTGCASGGFKLTREYAGFVNRQMIIIRIIVYLFTGIVFAITLLVDLVIFNTMDFWQGHVSQGTYDFHKDGKTYVAHHEILPGSSLKRSTIQVFGTDKKQLQEVVLQETSTGEIEMSVDGKLRARVRDIGSLPVASFFDANGAATQEKYVFFDLPGITAPLTTRSVAQLAR